MIVATLAEAAGIMRGRLQGSDASFRGVSTDTRNLEAEALFFALKGPNFDGAAFLRDAAEKLAAGAVVGKYVEDELAQIEVDDTVVALGRLAADWRRRLSARVVGLTGSNGKTTLKEMISSCLSRAATTIATHGNLNNQIGVPLMLLRIAPEHEYAVIEMGANHAGEIAYLTGLVAPEVVTITNAGAAHLEGFGSVEGVARAKGEILQGTPRPRIAVLNADDAWFEYWQGVASDLELLTFGTARSADFRAANIESRGGGLVFDLYTPDGLLEIELPLAGRHNAVNAAAAAAVAAALGLDGNTIRKGLAATPAVAGRLRALAGVGGLRVFDDSYNANPASVRAAADFLGAQEGDGWLVLGDMAELGADAAELHRSVGEAARESGVDRLYATGPEAVHAVNGFGEGGHWYETVDALIEAVRASLPVSGPVSLLVKGSRSMRMERVVRAFTAGIDDAPGEH